VLRVHSSPRCRTHSNAVKDVSKYLPSAFVVMSSIIAITAHAGNVKRRDDQAQLISLSPLPLQARLSAARHCLHTVPSLQMVASAITCVAAKKSRPVNDRSLPLQNLRDTDKTPSYRHHCEKHTSRLLRNCQWSLASSYHDHSQHPTDDRAKPGKNHDRFRDRLFSVALRSLNVPKGVRYGDD